MISVVFSIIVIFQGVFGLPAEELFHIAPTTYETRNFAVPKTYLGNFDVESLNPFNWSWNYVEKKSENDVKFEKFFQILECLAQEHENCGRLVDEAKIFFNKKSKVKPHPTKAPSTIGSIEHEGDAQVTITTVQPET